MLFETFAITGLADGAAKTATVTATKAGGSTVAFDAKVLEGDLAGAKGPAALFIDWWAVTPGGYVVHGHHGWYGYPPPVYAPYAYPPPPPPAATCISAPTATCRST